MGRNKSSLFAGQGPPSPLPHTSQAFGSHESHPSSFTKFFLLLSPLPGFPPPPPFSEKIPLSVSDAWPYSKLATKHPNTLAPLCLRDPPVCAGCLGRASRTPLGCPLPPRDAVPGVVHLPSPTESCVALCSPVWQPRCWGLALNLAARWCAVQHSRR